jgi:hypothetical protein
MKSHLMRGLMVAILAIPLLIASCSKKDKGTNPDTAPTLTVPSIAQAVNFVGSDAAIQSAKDKVQSEIALASPIFATAVALATAANSGSWGTKIDGCWSKSSSQGNCTTTHKVCDSSSGSYDWSRTLDGNCSGMDHSDWVDFDGTTGTDGGSGTLRLYKNNTTDVDSLWVWSTASDKNSKDWSVYSGTESVANRTAALHWSKGSGNSNDWTFETVANSTTTSAGAEAAEAVKWGLHVSADLKTGSMDVYQWSAAASPQAFWVQHHIEWADTTGTWIEYNQNGTIRNETTWPTTTTLPQIHNPNIGHDVVINSTDECAVISKSLVDGQIALARAFTSIGASFLGFFNSTEWGTPVGGCWTWSGTSLGCTIEYRLCQTSNGFSWTATQDGNCGGIVLDHFVVFEGTTSTDGTSGSLVIYETNTTTVAMTWTWTSTSDGKSGTWQSYSGIEAETNLESQVSWAENPDGTTDVIFEMFGSGRMKWVTHESADGTSGYMRMYEWDDTAPAYWKQTEIIWNADGSGSRIMYDRDETTILDECHWT